jgi:hypothetical protein
MAKGDGAKMSKRVRQTVLVLAVAFSFLLRGIAQGPSSFQAISPQTIEAAVRSHFSLGGQSVPPGTVFVAATRVGPAFGLPTEDSPSFLYAIDRLANPAIRSPLPIETVDSVYEYILTFRQLPRFVYSKGDRRSLKRINHILLRKRFFLCSLGDWVLNRHPPRQPSKAYLRYFLFAQQVAESKDQYAAALKANASSTILNSLQSQTDALNRLWITKGRKATIEHTMTEYQAITAKNPVNIWNRIALSYSASTVQVGGVRLPKTGFVPNIGSWRDNTGWSVIDLASVGDPVNRLRIKSIEIVRTWMDERVFGSLDWEWVRSAPLGKDHVVSDGLGLTTVMTRSKTIGLLPEQIVLGQYQGPDGKWTDNEFLLGYLTKKVSITPKR